MLHDTSLVLASTFFGSHESDRLVRLDLHEVIEREQGSKDKIQRVIHSTIVHLVQTCPRRSMLVLENVERVPQHLISLLDVFLLPLSGKIAHKDRWLDTLPTVFVFLFQTDKPPASRDSWRDFMEQQWPYTGVEFTPRALIGRIREAVFVNSDVDHSRCDFPPDQSSLQLPPYAVEAIVTALAVVTVGVVAYLARKDDEPEVQFLPKKEHKQQPKQSVTVTVTQERHVVETKSTTIEEVAEEQIIEESVLRTKKSKKQRRRSTQSPQVSESQESQEAEPKQSTTQLVDEEKPDEILETTVEATVAEGTIQEATDEPKQPTSRTAARGKGKARRQPKAEVPAPTRHSSRLEEKKSTKKTQ
ncbi:hypothetical protein AC1031_004578 [Aphanomyces cochlioides]|nr:hypothetical protein AC1031_004578 [Aphanomyces cochlioides]